MCLYTLHSKASVATKDIVCYKIVLHSTNSAEKYMAPYMGTTIKEDCIKGEKPYCAVGKPDPIMPIMWESYRNRVDGGCIHTYINKQNAVDELAFLRTSHKSDNYELYKCVIPAGAEYFSGCDCSGDDSYASTSIIFKEKICV